MNNIPWDNMDEHKKVCPLEMIECEYHCGAIIARNEVSNHNKEKMSEHFQLSEKAITKLFSELHNEDSGQCKELSEQLMRSVQIATANHNGPASYIRSYLTTEVLYAIIVILLAIVIVQSYNLYRLEDHMTELHEKINKLQGNHSLQANLLILHEQLQYIDISLLANMSTDELKQTLLQVITHLQNNSLSSEEMRELKHKM